MVDPALALLVFAVIAAFSAILLWPKKGLLALTKRFLGMTERVRIEDALKHLYNCEYVGVSPTIESLAGSLQITRHRATRLVTRLRALGLAEASGEGFPRTEPGRTYALRVLRTHRLWERYLADRTGVAPTQWHEEAEVHEHRLSEADTEALAASLGHPRFDPHGDPIPTAKGDLPPQKGVALTTLRPGQTARIVHLEDEPRELYDELIAEGLSPLMKVHITEVAPDGVRFMVEGREHVLEPIVASSVTVDPDEDVVVATEPPLKLTDLKAGESGLVVGISRACQGPARRRLLDLGVVPGTSVRAVLESTGGDPVAYDVRGALTALRNEQASWIEISRSATASSGTVPANEEAS